MMITVEIKRAHKKRRYQEEDYCEYYCNSGNEETTDNDTDKTNLKKHHLKKEISNYFK